MDAIKEQLKNPLIVGVTGFVVGLLIGWIVVGWVIWPVQWNDAGPSDLEKSWQEDYLRMAIDAYASSSNQAEALDRWNGLESDAQQLLDKIAVSPDLNTPESINAFSQAVSATISAETEAVEGEVEAESEEGAGAGGSNITKILVLCGIVSVLTVVVVVYLFIFRRRKPFSDVLSPAAQAQEYTSQTEPTDFAARGDDPPMTQFMTTYMQGDDLFDDSFSIDSSTGEFLGECGVGISEAIGVGEPKKVAAYEVWLFDKNDIQTVTKVLMSDHAHSDDTLRDRLEKKGEPFLAEPGAEMILETATLRLVARVVDMVYGSGATPQRSFFERLTLELAVWQK
ncbi:MAG: hypothetical protein U9Q82_01555 [Chloroflexota bacterium]|nr:hypothetical protein [Chloroflexota bacterium]